MDEKKKNVNNHINSQSKMKKILMATAFLLTVLSMAPSCQRLRQPVKVESVALYTKPGDPVSSAAGTKGVTISATGDWTVSSKADWISVSPSSGSRGINEVILNYTENTGKELRTGSIVFTAKGGYSETYILKQNPAI